MSKQGEHGITWTDETWNPIRGCSRVSEGCRNCYAERVAARFGGAGQPYEGLARMTPSGPRWTGEARLVEEHLLDPLRWTRPRRVFVNSMSDLFHESLPEEAIDRVFAMMARAGRHTFQVLTKRPERMLAYCRARSTADGRGYVWHIWPLPNVWLGVSVEDQATADERIPMLLQTPAAVRWVSAEPLLEALDLRRWLTKGFQSGYDEMMASLPVQPSCVPPHLQRPTDGIDWLVVGGESGPGARPMHPDWARSLRDQCQGASVPFHFKQWGDWWPLSQTPDGWLDQNPISQDRQTVLQLDGDERFDFPAGAMTCLRVGKRAAGRLLDGRTWDEFPKVTA